MTELLACAGSEEGRTIRESSLRSAARPSAPRKSARMARMTKRVISTTITTKIVASVPATYGCRVASQVRPMARTSSPRLSVMFENGSGDGVTAARAAVLPPCAMSATVAPRSVARSWCSGESWLVARYASSPAMGTRMNVCSAFQIRSKAGILSAKNSIPKRARLATMTGHPASSCNPGGSGRCAK